MYYRTVSLQFSSKLFLHTKSSLFQVQSHFPSSIWIPSEQTVLQVFTQRPKTILRNSLKLHVDTCSCKSFSFNRFRSYFCVPLSWNKPTIRNKFFDEKHLRKQYLSTKIMAEASKSGGEKRKLENGESETASPTAKKGKDEDFLSRIAESRTEVCQSVAEFKFNKKRVRVLSKAKDFPDESKGVVYWMSRDQRVQGIYVILYDNIKIHGPAHWGLEKLMGCMVPQRTDLALVYWLTT